MGWVLRGVSLAACGWQGKPEWRGGQEQLAGGGLCRSEEAGDSGIHDREPQNGFNHKDEIIGLVFQKDFPGRNTKDDESEGCVIGGGNQRVEWTPSRSPAER